MKLTQLEAISILCQKLNPYGGRLVYLEGYYPSGRKGNAALPADKSHE